MDTDLLSARWARLLPGQHHLGAELLSRYADPSRHYHDVLHLSEVLERVDLLGPDDVVAVQLAAWFHDAVYDARRADSEERSARLATSALTAAGVDAPRVAEVARLVRLTARHDAADGDRNGAVLCDADLAILAADAQRYADYVVGVRAEYAHMDDTGFAAGRAAVLERLLGVPRLFRTPRGHDRWEATARTNMLVELGHLRG